VRIVLTRLRLLITSVFSEMGRGRPCSLRKRPQALHRTEPNSSRLHSGVVDVLQFWHVGCECVLVAIMVPVEVDGGLRQPLITKAGSIIIYRDNDKAGLSEKSLPHAAVLIRK
jgi:hypothetical protein